MASNPQQIQSDIASSLSGASLGVNATYFNSVEQANIHPFYKRKIISVFGTSRLTSWIDVNTTPSTRPAMSFNHEEVGWSQDPIYAAAAASGLAGAPVTITLTAGSLAGGTSSPLSVGFTVLFKNDTFGEVTAIPAENQITVTPSQNQIISVGINEAFIFAPASFVAEGSCSGDSNLRFPPINFNSTMQPIRLDLTITDIAYASFSQEVTFFDWAAADGTSSPCWTHSALIDREVQMHNARELVLLTGQQYTNAGLTSLGHNSTNGVIPVIKTAGNFQPYDKNAGFQISDIKDMYITMEKNHAPRSYMFSMGVDLSVSLYDAIKDYFPNTEVAYDCFDGMAGGMGNDGKTAETGRMKSLAMGFNAVKFNNRDFYFQGNEIFTHPSFLGAPGFNYTGAAIAMPMTKMMNGNNEVGYVETPRLQGQCSPVLGYRHWVTDGTGIINSAYLGVTPCRRMVFSWWDTLGVEVFGARQLYFLQGQ